VVRYGDKVESVKGIEYPGETIDTLHCETLDDAYNLIGNL